MPRIESNYTEEERNMEVTITLRVADILRLRNLVHRKLRDRARDRAQAVRRGKPEYLIDVCDEAIEKFSLLEMQLESVLGSVEKARIPAEDR